MSTENLRQKQSRFCRMTAELILWAFNHGYDLTFGHALRCQDCKTGKTTSLHKIRLAVDLMAFRGEVYLTSTDDYKELGEYWESIGGTWGGRFKSIPDGNHFSLEHNCMK